MRSRWLGVFLALSCAPAGATLVSVDLISAGGTAHRWRDIADNLYAPAYQGSFSYANASVRLEYETFGTTFTGRLVGDGLKPFFGYQLKFTAPHFDPLMERLGYLGRWTWAGGPLNVSDAMYEANETNPTISSFMVFDYAVTDASGHIDEPFAIDSTYHVLWRNGVTGVSGVAFPGPHDGYSIQTLVEPGRSPAGTYDGAPGPDTVNVFGEYEHTLGNVRPYPGELVMPSGDYALDFILTEESFHGWRTDDGFWMTALQSPQNERITFTIGTAVVPEPGSLLLLLAGLSAVAARRKARPRRG